MNWHNLFCYKSGKLYWLTTQNNFVKAGSQAGCVTPNGYISVMVGGKTIPVHRIVWEMHNGAIPIGMEIDHINHVRSDNDINNLRLVTRKDNMKNKSISKNNKSGCHGVSWYAKSSFWVARITVNGKKLFLGQSKDLAEAIKLRKEAEITYGFHRNHGN